MLIQTISNIVNENTKDNNILAIIKVGSQIYSDEPNDKDYFVITDKTTLPNRIHHKQENSKTLDIMILDEQTFLNKINLEKTKITHIIYNYQVTDYFVKDNILYKKDNYEIPTFDLTNKDIREKYLSLMKEYHNEMLDRLPFKFAHYAGKMYVHYYIAQKITDEGVIELTQLDYDNINLLRSHTEEASELIKQIRDNYEGD